MAPPPPAAAGGPFPAPKAGGRGSRCKRASGPQCLCQNDAVTSPTPRVQRTSLSSTNQVRMGVFVDHRGVPRGYATQTQRGGGLHEAQACASSHPRPSSGCQTLTSGPPQNDALVTWGGGGLPGRVATPALGSGHACPPRRSPPPVHCLGQCPPSPRLVCPLPALSRAIPPFTVAWEGGGGGLAAR